jgi:excisionase family DNA binding protein
MQSKVEADGRGPEDQRDLRALLERILNELAELRSAIAGQRKELLTVDELARLTGRSAYTVRRWINEGRLRATRVEGTGPRGRLLIPSDQISSLIPQGLGAQLPPITGEM